MKEQKREVVPEIIDGKLVLIPVYEPEELAAVWGRRSLEEGNAT